MVCVRLRMWFYFITQTVDILYGTLRARGLADYGTEGVSGLATHLPCYAAIETSHKTLYRGP